MTQNASVKVHHYAIYQFLFADTIMEKLSCQAKVLNEGGDLRQAQVDVPLLSAIPLFDRKAGLNDRHFNSNRGICLPVTILKSG